MKMTPQKWLDAIHLQRKEEKDWREEAKKVVDIYRDEEQSARFNVLWPNVEIMRPSLYNSAPVPDVRRRFRDPDPVGKEGAKLIERGLSYALDDYDFDFLMEQTVLDYLLPGRAIARVRYVAYDADGKVLKGDEHGKAYERVECCLVDWDRFTRGPGRKWKDVDWICFEHQFDKDELKENYTAWEKVQLDVSISDKDAGEETDETKKRGKVYEVWDKRTRKVYHIAPSYPEEFLKEESDPLELKQFFPIPRPLYAIQTTNSLVPIPEYRLYKRQAEEVDALSRRIQKIIDACRVRGIYNATIKEFSQLVDAADGTLLPAENAAALAATGEGLDKAIAWWPVEQIAAVLAQLYTQREAAKQAIYELTGLSDILRGASNPNETLGAQELKAQTGSVRLQRRQKDVARFARDLMRLKAEIMVEHFAPETLAVMTGMQIQPEVLMMLKDDNLRSYRIDIETDSTIAGDATREKEAVIELLGGIGNFAQGIGPAVESGAISQQAAKTMLKAGIRRFKFGAEVEDAIEEGETPEGQVSQEDQAMMAEQQAAMQAEQEAMMQQAVEQRVAEHEKIAKTQIESARLQLEQQRAAAENQLAQQKQAQDAELARAKLQIDAEGRATELELRARELELREREIALREAESAIGANERRQERHERENEAAETGERENGVQMMLQQITEAMNALTEYVTAPKSVVYENGRAVGIKVGDDTRPIERDDAGKVTGLQ